MRVFLGICLCIILAGGVLIALDGEDAERRTGEMRQRTVREANPSRKGDPVDDGKGAAPVEGNAGRIEADPGVDDPDELDAGTIRTVQTDGEPALVKRIDDRSIRLDDRYVLRGNGTERDPFTISWELLSSARSTIDAAGGELDPPAHVSLLDGAWIRIDGYYSSPLLEEEVSDVLHADCLDLCVFCLPLPRSRFLRPASSPTARDPGARTAAAALACAAWAAANARPRRYPLLALPRACAAAGVDARLFVFPPRCPAGAPRRW